MNWFIVPRLRPKPTTGTYPDWKPQIAQKCGHQCVYCTISEGEYGGIDNFHVEHFRPKSRFKKIENDIDNLFIACAICNRFKSDEWPGEPHKKGLNATFLDPSVTDYHQHLELALPSVYLRGKTIAGSYMLERLYLNRAQLLVSRRYRVAIAALRAATSYLNSEIGKLSATGASGHSLVEQIAAASLRINELQGRLAEARPYDAGATRRDGSPSPTKARKRKR